MKQSFLLLVFLLGMKLFAQNNPPTIAIQNVSVDQTLQKVSITYNLADLQGDPCEVWLKMSQDGGDFYSQIPATNLSGDIGATIIPSGATKNIVWDYSSNFTGNIYATKIKLYASDYQPVSIADMVSQVDSNKVRNVLSYIEGYRNVSTGLAHLNEIRDSIETNFLRYGLTTERHNFPYSTYTGENILGRKAGAKDEAITYIMDAHYDAVPISPGADDNGSGVAGVLEALRILSQYEFEHSIRFVGFDFEEAGLVGSQKYIQTGLKPYENISGVLNYEMIGFYASQPNTQAVPNGFNMLFPQAYQSILADSSRGNFLFVCGNSNSSSLSSLLVTTGQQYVPALRIIKADVPGTGSVAPDLRRSDHAPFWDAGKKAVMLTDCADFRNANYHTAGDSVGTLNFTFMSNVIKATLATMATLAVPISSGSDMYDLSGLNDISHEHKFPAKVVLFPNPTKDELNLRVTTEKNLPTRMEIYDLTGKMLWNKITTFEQGESIQKFSLENLPKGAYILLLTSEESTFSQGFTVQ